MLSYIIGEAKNQAATDMRRQAKHSKTQPTPSFPFVILHASLSP